MGLFSRKPLELLLEEMKGEHRLRRVLGPVQLTALGVGAIIGAGIFVATGAAAHNVGGPALMISYCVAGITCVFAALCYAEFASMAPVAGSAFTYAYATLGELFAWIIGWDLVLEYAVGSATVANGWSSYFQSVLGTLHYELPKALNGPVIVYDPKIGHLVATGSIINLPALVVVAAATVPDLPICTVHNVAVVAVLTGMVPFDKLDINAPVATAFAQVGLGWAKLLIALAGAAGITSVLLVMMLSQPRVLLAMARDGMLPPSFFGAVHERFRTPWKSTIATGIFVGAMAAFLPI